jgi:hypothetical protein
MKTYLKKPFALGVAILLLGCSLASAGSIMTSKRYGTHHKKNTLRAGSSGSVTHMPSRSKASKSATSKQEAAAAGTDKTANKTTSVPK